MIENVQIEYFQYYLDMYEVICMYNLKRKYLSLSLYGCIGTCHDVRYLISQYEMLYEIHFV